ncbi:MAG: MmgE/PrpD family protein [Bacteroidales bacterium]|nr:MmgE/PrpD family protein [Bacteroidales bacterium]
MDTISPQIAQYVAQTQFENLSPKAISSAKRSTLDTFAAMLAGSSGQGIDVIVNLASGWGGAPEASLIAHEIKLPSPAAAWCNGSMARALEIDDCVDFLPVHPSASAIPALLSLAEYRGDISGHDFITALALGQDLIIRLGMTLNQNAMQSGRNNMFKIFGPTASVAKALNLDPAQVQHALGIAFSHAIGDGQCALDGALSIRLQQGLVAQGAVISGLLAEKGFTGAQEFLLGRWGYLKVWEPDPHLEYLTDGLGKKFYGEQITIKPFSSCRATHSSIDLALSLTKKYKFSPDDIDKIIIYTSPEIHNLVATPHEIKCRPDSVPTAQFSIQYTVAAAIIQGDMFLTQLSPKLFQSKKMNSLSEKIKVKPDKNLRTNTALGRTLMEIITKDGAVFKDEIANPSGSPKKPLSYEECGAKLLKCADYAVRSPSKRQLEWLIDKVWHLEKLDDVSILMIELF